MTHPYRKLNALDWTIAAFFFLAALLVLIALGIGV